MQFPVMDINGNQVSTVELPADIFEAKINKALMHQALVRQLANARLGTHSTKRRSEVHGTTAKIYKQKGTGRARHGNRTATQFVGGGRPMGPKPRDYTQSMPKKMRRGAIRSALSALAADNQLIFVDVLPLDAPKTKDAKRILTTFVGEGTALVLINSVGDQNVQLSFGNLPNAQTLRANYLNIRDLLRHDKVIVPLAALDVIKQIWGMAE